MKLVSDWRRAWRWYTTWIAGSGFLFSSIATALAATGAVVPWFAVIKPWECFAMAAVVFFGILIGRLIKQNGKRDDDS